MVPMLILLKFIATFAAAIFAGAALYISVAEHPAWMTLDTRFAAAQWVPSYQRATWMQASTLIVILTTNKALLAPGRDLDSAARVLLEHWGKIHMVRTALGLAATILYLCLALGT